MSSRTLRKISVSSPSFCNNPSLVESLFKSFPHSEIQINSSGTHFSGKDLIRFFQSSDAIILGTEKFSKEIIDELPELKVVSKYGVGVDNVDIAYLRNQNISFCWEGGVNRRSVSEMTLAFMIGLFRNVFFSNSLLTREIWQKRGGTQLSGKTIGILGCGFIGEDLLRILQPFHCKILIHDILDKSIVASCYGASQVTLEKILEEADLITLHLPLTDDTRGLVNANFFQRMKRGSFLVNTCRGGVVVEEDLKLYLEMAIHSHPMSTIQGAAIDVLQKEPPESFELLKLPNLFATPHIGGNALEAVLAMGNSAIAGLIAWEKEGNIPINQKT